MFQIVFGRIGFRCFFDRGEIAVNGTNVPICHAALSLGVVGFIWWSSSAARLYFRCVRLSIKDAERVVDIDGAARRRAQEETRKAWEAIEAARESDDRCVARLNQQLMELRTENSELKTAIREMIKVRDEEPTP